MGIINDKNNKAMTQEERKRIENACSTLFPDADYKDLYLQLNHLLLSYSSLMAEHDPNFGEVPSNETCSSLYTIEVLIKAIEPLIIEDLKKA